MLSSDLCPAFAISLISYFLLFSKENDHLSMPKIYGIHSSQFLLAS